MRYFDFQEQIKMSEGISQKKDTASIIASCFPFAAQVERANTSDDRNGTDYWVTMQSGHKVSVDVKVRKEDFAKRQNQDDLALETWSVIGRKVGWTRDTAKRTDYILFIWQETGRWMLIPFPILCDIFCKNWQNWIKAYKTAPQNSTNEYGTSWKSECVFVPRKVIWSKYYQNFGGIPIAENQQPKEYKLTNQEIAILRNLPDYGNERESV